jgi:hypothetical protein
MNQLTHEQLDMIKRLQPLFREKTGEWQVGDVCYHDFYGLGVTVNKVYGTGVHVAFESQVQHCDTSYLLRIPKPIDWQNPERDLWGMLKDDKRIEEGKTYCVVWSDYNSYEAPDPFTALLMALVQQEGV